MSRLMSVSHTEEAVRDRRKTVTRRVGWRFLKPGDRLTLCRKVMGRKRGEPLIRIAEVEVVDVARIPLRSIDHDDIEREGVPALTFTPANPVPDEHELECNDCQRANWIGWFARTMGVRSDVEVTRIEWRYL